MRAGGRFADLRHQFNNALETERGLAAAYDKAAAALARYGQDRVGIEQVIVASNGRANCIDFSATVPYPKRASGSSTGSAAKANKTVVRCA